MKVGFIGLGTMGAYMAANLSRYLESSNHGLVVHDTLVQTSAETNEGEEAAKRWAGVLLTLLLELPLELEPRRLRIGPAEGQGFLIGLDQALKRHIAALFQARLESEGKQLAAHFVLRLHLHLGAHRR